MDNNLIIGKKTLKIEISSLLIATIMFCVLLTGLVPQIMLDILILVVCVALLLQGELYLSFPFMLFYYRYFGLIFGVSTYRLYTFLVLFDGVLKLAKRPVITFRYSLPVFVYGLYLAFAMAEVNQQKAVFSFVDVLSCIAIISLSLRDDVKNIRKFFNIYVLVALAAFVTGLINGNVLVLENVWEETKISRFNATFEDPNYMGFFFTTAVFATVSLKLFNPKLRWIIVIALNVMMLASVSMTAIVVNILLWLVYLALSKQINLKTCVVGIFVVLLAVNAYQYGLENPDAPVLGDLSYRISEKLEAAETGDIDKATTSRSALAKEHWEYFLKQPIGKKLFGGTLVNASYILPELGRAAHNEYIDMLLNVGVLGFAVLIGYMLIRTYDWFKIYRKTKENAYLCILMCKGVWLSYAATLTLFLEWRFMLLFFI